MEDRPPLPVFARNLPPIAVATFFMMMAVLQISGQSAAYEAIIEAWGLEPFRFPFVDTDAVLSAIRCFNRGIDAYAANPCDPLGRVDSYPPTWRVLQVLPITEAWIAPAGLLVNAGFIAALFMLPKPRTWRGCLLMTLGAVSSATMFAMERGNSDLLLFLLVASAAVLIAKSRPWRVIAYALVLTAGLLKYYPMAAMALAARERPTVFLKVAAVSIAATIIAFGTFWRDLPGAFANIPGAMYFQDQYGSMILAGGMAQLLGLPDAVRFVAWLAIVLASVFVATVLARLPDTSSALNGLTDGERAFLLVGVMMTLGSFFAGHNIGYRTVLLLLALPSLISLARQGAALRFRAGPVLAVLLLWNMGWRANLRQLAEAVLGADNGLVPYVLWLVREGLWWSLVTILMSLAIALLAASRTGRAVIPAGWRRLSGAQGLPIGA